MIPEYDNIDANTAAELVIRAKAKEATAAPQIPQQQQQYPPPSAYPPAQYGASPTTAQQQQQPNIANLISSLDGPALQNLLSVMQQPGVNPASQPQPQLQAQPDIQALLGSLGRQNASQPAASQGTSTGYGGFQQPQQQQQPQQAGYGAYTQGQPQQQQQQQQQPAYGQQYQAVNPTANVQGVLDRLGRWKQ